MVDNVLKGRTNNTVFDLGIQKAGGGYAIASLDEDVLAKLDEVLIELQGKFEGAPVALDAPTIATLKEVTAAITGAVDVSTMPDVVIDAATVASLQQATVSGEVSLDAATIAALKSITGSVTVSGTVTVSNPTADPETGLAKEVTLQQLLVELQSKLESGAAVALDATTLAALESVNASVTGEVSVTGLQTDALTDAQLRASDVRVTFANETVTMSNPTADPETGLAKDVTLQSVLTELQSKLDAGGQVALDAPTLAALENINAIVSGEVTVTGLQTNALTNTELRASDVPVTDASQVEGTRYLNNRYSGGKLAVVATVTAAGDTVILTPSLGKRLEIYWVYALPSPSSESFALINIRLGSNDIYRTYAIAHWEKFVGGIDEPLVVNLSAVDNVAVTVHYKEVA